MGGVNTVRHPEKGSERLLRSRSCYGPERKINSLLCSYEEEEEAVTCKVLDVLERY